MLYLVYYEGSGGNKGVRMTHTAVEATRKVVEIEHLGWTAEPRPLQGPLTDTDRWDYMVMRSRIRK